MYVNRISNGIILMKDLLFTPLDDRTDGLCSEGKDSGIIYEERLFDLNSLKMKSENNEVGESREPEVPTHTQSGRVASSIHLISYRCRCSVRFG